MMKKNSFEEEAPTNSTGSSVAGTDGDPTSVSMKKKKKLFKRKKLKSKYEVGKSPDKELVLKKEDVDAPVADVKPNLSPDTTFATMPVFKVSSGDFIKCQHGKEKHKRWNKHIDLESDYGKKIHTYARKNPDTPIIVQCDQTGHMVYLRKYKQVEK